MISKKIIIRAKFNPEFESDWPALKAEIDKRMAELVAMKAADEGRKTAPQTYRTRRMTIQEFLDDDRRN